MKSRASHLSRRELIKGALAAEAAVLAGCSSHHNQALTQSVQRENLNQGTMDWILKNTRIDPKTKYRCPWIEGYCSHTSIRAGEELSIFVSTNPASAFSLDIYRMGYYGGMGGRHVMSAGSIEGRA